MTLGGPRSETPPSGPPMRMVHAEPASGAGPEDLEARLTAALRAELSHAMVAITAIRNELGAITGGVRRMEQRLAGLEERLAEAPSTAADAGAHAEGEEGSTALVVSREATRAMAAVERRLRDVNDRTAQEILDAILAVAQHLEAVQTATSWTMLQELRND